MAQPAVDIRRERFNCRIDGAADAREVAPPTQEDLRVLRQEVDPAGVYLKAEDAVSGSRR